MTNNINDKNNNNSNINNIIGNTKNKNIINNDSNNKNVNITKNKIVYKFSNNKKDKELKKIERPGLQDIGIGKIITFEAVLVGKYRNNDACYTVMNLHQGRKYLADHT